MTTYVVNRLSQAMARSSRDNPYGPPLLWPSGEILQMYWYEYIEESILLRAPGGDIKYRTVTGPGGDEMRAGEFIAAGVASDSRSLWHWTDENENHGWLAWPIGVFPLDWVVTWNDIGWGSGSEGAWDVLRVVRDATDQASAQMLLGFLNNTRVEWAPGAIESLDES